MATKRRKTGRPTWGPKQPFAERDGGKLMTPAEVASVLGTGERHVWRLLDSGELPKVRVGRKVRVHIEDVDAYIAKQRTPVK